MNSESLHPKVNESSLAKARSTKGTKEQGPGSWLQITEVYTAKGVRAENLNSMCMEVLDSSQLLPMFGIYISR